MRYADMALYRAKNEGRNRACIYDAAMDADLSSRKLLEADLREAIENDHLRLLYQPIVNKSGETVISVEALCRWTHPTRGEIPPSEFIAIAEHSGLIIELGNWVLRRACTDGKAWPELTVAVNVSSLQFRRIDFVEVVERILTRDSASIRSGSNWSSPKACCSAISTPPKPRCCGSRRWAYGSRSTILAPAIPACSICAAFRSTSSRSTAASCARSKQAADAAAIVHAIVSLGRGLGMKVTAEGVETADQLLFLRAAGVHSMQGYRFGKAVSVEEITARLQSPSAFQATELAALAS